MTGGPGGQRIVRVTSSCDVMFVSSRGGTSLVQCTTGLIPTLFAVLSLVIPRDNLHLQVHMLQGAAEKLRPGMLSSPIPNRIDSELDTQVNKQSNLRLSVIM